VLILQGSHRLLVLRLLQLVLNNAGVVVARRKLLAEVELMVIVKIELGNYFLAHQHLVDAVLLPFQRQLLIQRVALGG
jgi:hypothetical protein